MGLKLSLTTLYETTLGAQGRETNRSRTSTTLISGKRDAHRRLHIYPGFFHEGIFPIFCGGKQRPSRKWLTKVKIGSQDSKLTHQLGSQAQNTGEWGSTEKLPRLLMLIKSLADSSAKYGRPYG